MSNPTTFQYEADPAELRAIVSDLSNMFRNSKTADGATVLGIAYAMQDDGLFPAPYQEDDDVERNYEFLREHLDRGRLETLLSTAGCTETPDNNWIVEGN